MRKILSSIFVAAVVITAAVLPASAIDGVYHDPYGLNCIYDIQPTEMSPKLPAAGENVLLNCTTWPIESGQTVWITYTVNGTSKPAICASWRYNDGNNSYWQANIGSFSKGDTVVYTVHSNKDGANEKTIGPYTFKVAGWEHMSSVSLASQTGGKVIFNAVANTGTFSPKLSLSFPTASTVRFQLSPKGNASFASGITNYTVSQTSSAVTITTSALRVTVTKQPYSLEVYDLAKQKVLSTSGGVGNEMSWLTDGNNIIEKVEEGYNSPSDEQFYGFGEHYGNFTQRGKAIDTYCYNQYQNQGDKTYYSVPFFYSSKGYGIYLNTTAISKFDMASSNQSQYSFAAETDGTASSMLDYYFISGSPLDIIGEYNNISGHPQELPKWAFGLWMSANEWDRQSEVINAMNQSINNDIPATAVVLEQWSDENTFYIFNDATYTPKSGAQSFSNSDFTYGTKWPNPKAMADTLHNNGMKLILWQVPVLKNTSYAYAQKDNDEQYMISQGYAVGNGSGGQYRIPSSGWFGNSLLLDFTNQSAVNWWMQKRSYLVNDIGIDGFKTDGGEMVWGKNTSFSNGKTESEMRNEYPKLYVKAYNDYIKNATGNPVTFSRSGTAGSQQYGIYWSGDQNSSFSAFRDAVRAGLSAGISGTPYWSWDLAGFTGTFPSAELYKRSVEMAAFSPVMQFHSEKSDPSPSEERSPWNVQSRTGDTTVIPTFRKYINTRMNLLPYIYSEAQRSAKDGVPMMRAMILEAPEDVNTYSLDSEYMFGQNLLVAPIVNEGDTVKTVYLPKGDWIDFYHNARTAGGGNKSYYADINSIPVYVKNGSIIPMNFNSSYELGGTIGNNVDTYNNLTFRIYPSGNSTYTLVNNDKSEMTVSAAENFANKKVTITLPASNIPITTQTFATKPTGVQLGSTNLTEYTSLSAFSSATSGYYYSKSEKFCYVKVPASASTRTITLLGVNNAPYEAEHATLNNVSTNNNHSDFYGDSFVDGFAENGDYVQFDVNSDTARTATLKVRYSAGSEQGLRTVSVNGKTAVNLALPKTTDWDTWNEASISVNLNAGRNTVKIAYSSSCYAGINLDCVRIE